MNNIQITALPNVPYIDNGDNISDIIINSVDNAKITFKENDILCVSSKAVSISEGRIMSLNDVVVSDVANKIHKKIPRKDPRTIQVIIDETGSPDGSRIDLDINYIAGWLPNGLRLTNCSGMSFQHGILKWQNRPINNRLTAQPTKLRLVSSIRC